MKEDKFTYTFSKGAKAEGTLQEILAMAKALGETVDASKFTGGFPSGYFNSSSKGLIRIEDMDTIHLLNSLAKAARDYIESARVHACTGTTWQSDIKQFLEDFVNLGSQVVINELFEELQKRSK